MSNEIDLKNSLEIEKDNIQLEDSIEYEETIEFDLNDYHSLIYSKTNKNWRKWWLDGSGNEFEEPIENIELMNELFIGLKKIEADELVKFMNIVLGLDKS